MVAKRQRPAPPTAISSIPPLFAPFRALGIVTYSTAVHVFSRGLARYITAPLQRSFQVFDVNTMNLVGVGPLFEQTVTAVAGMEGDWTCVGLESGDIVLCYRMKETYRLSASFDTSSTMRSDKSVQSIFVYGDEILVLHACGVVRMWNTKDREMTSELNSHLKHLDVTCVVHPDTYVNKICIGTRQGKLHIFNTRASSIVHTIKARFSAAITTLVQSPALDVLAVGLADGTIHMYNILQDEFLFSLKQPSAITAVSFCTAKSIAPNHISDQEQAIMVSGTASGELAVWDLEKQRLIIAYPSLHEGTPISQAYFLPGEPLLVTSGGDNAIKQWIFDQPDCVPRLLKSRSGHRDAPNMVRWFQGTARIDSTGGTAGDTRWLFTTGSDRSFRLTSAVRESQSVEMSQGSLAKNAKKYQASMDALRLSPVTHFSSSYLREREWDNVVTSHAGESFGRTWSTQRRALGKHKLEARDGARVSCTATSACGNFAFIGTETGRVDAFNIQSGIYQRSYGVGTNSHSKAVTGIFVDVANRYLVSTSLDGAVKVWKFSTAQQLGSVLTSSPIHRARVPVDLTSDLIATAHDDFRIRIIDVVALRIVRTFVHLCPIIDLAWSPDSRWVTASGSDGVVRTWDVATGFEVHRFETNDFVTGLDWSPDGRWLATIHSGTPGIFLWTNRALFANVPLRRLEGEAPVKLDMPRVEHGMLGDTKSTINDEVDTVTEILAEKLVVSLPNLTKLHAKAVKGLVQLSDEPKSKWHTLLNLETIKKRNKPKEAPKEPERAPFLLPTLPGPKFKFLTEAEGMKKTGSASDAGPRVVKLDTLRPVTEFVSALRDGFSKDDYSEAVKMLENMTVSAMDLEIRTLSPLPMDISTRNEDDDMDENPSKTSEFELFLSMIVYILSRLEKFDLAQAALSQFLNCHADVILTSMSEDSNEDGISQRWKEQLETIQTLTKQEWRRVEARMGQASCLLEFTRRGRTF